MIKKEETEFGSIEAASLGGKARANSLTPDQRKNIARKAVEARWEKAGKNPLPKATHEGLIHIGSAEIACAVLDDHRRVLTQSAFYIAIGRTRTPKAGTGVHSTVDKLPFFLQAELLKPFISPELLLSTSPVFFHDKSGRRMVGYDAELLPMVAEVYLKMRDWFAKEKKDTPQRFAHIVEACDTLIRGLARVGIRALVDEATGYQYDRPRRDLEKYLERFLAESLRRWVRTFPADYFKHLCRLRGIQLREDMKLPQYFGTLTNNLVYRRMAPGLLRRLKDRRDELGAGKLHTALSLDFGVPEVLVHLGTVVGIMKINTDYDAFEKQLDQIAPIYPADPTLFDNPDDWDSTKFKLGGDQLQNP
jgi:hypothetical protein